MQGAYKPLKNAIRIGRQAHWSAIFKNIRASWRVWESKILQL